MRQQQELSMAYIMAYRYGSGSKPCTPVVHIKIAGKWMFIPLKMVLIGIDPYPYDIPETCEMSLIISI
jgi:hypothetical protein